VGVVTTPDELEAQGWQVDNSPAPAAAMIVLGGRFPPDMAGRIMTEAQERGVKVSEVLRDLVAEAYAARDRTDDEPVMVRPSEAARWLRSAGRRAA
jgi:hypothetical protein